MDNLLTAICPQVRKNITFGLDTNEYAAALVQNSLTMDVLFEAV